MKIPGGGGVAGGGPRGREGVCSELGNFGGGAKYFFSGQEFPFRNLLENKGSGLHPTLDLARQTDKQTDGETDRQSDRQIDR